MKHETKGGLAPLSTVSGLRDFRKMHTSTWKILYGTICMFAKLRFSFSENIYLEKKALKIFIPMQSFPSLFLNVVSVVFGPHSLNWRSNRCVAQFHDQELSGLKSWSLMIQISTLQKTDRRHQGSSLIPHYIIVCKCCFANLQALQSQFMECFFHSNCLH